MPLLTFRAALDETSELRQRHLLLGNGFSIACRPDIFRYGRLFERADFARLSAGARGAFDALGTQDFERVIKALRDTRTILSAYREAPEEFRERLRGDADGLREVLVSAIAGSHPARPADITDPEYESCRRFLSCFNRIYSVNYDLLLYWAQMHEPSEVKLDHDDGFRTPEDENDAEYVVWDGSNSRDQDTYYLHGGLHIVDTGVEVRKLTWTNTGIALIDQITAALARDEYPLFVSEGSAQEKLARIKHSDYLARGWRSLREIQGALFVYGLSMSDNDAHVLQQIARGKASHLYVGIYGDPRSDANRLVITVSQRLATGRRERNPLTVQFFDAVSAGVWR
jgi:Domain of unknown function (DUF4917)